MAKYIGKPCTPDLEKRGSVMLGATGSSCEMKMQEIVGSSCNPSADEYIGVRGSDGACHPIQKNKWMTFNDCAPDLEGRGIITVDMFTSVARASRPTLKCEIPNRPLPQSPLEDMRQEIEQLRGEIQQLREGK